MRYIFQSVLSREELQSGDLDSESLIDAALFRVEEKLNPSAIESGPTDEQAEIYRQIREELEQARPSDLQISNYDVGRNLYTAEIHGGRDPSEYNYVQWRKEGEAGRIRSALNEALEEGRLSSEEERLATIALESLREDEQSFTMSERIEDSDTGKDAYKRIAGQFRLDPRVEGIDGQKPTSELLLAAGIDGIKYRADGGEADAFNYTVFDDNAVEIAEQVRFQRQRTEGDASAEGDIPPNPNAVTADWSPSNLAQIAKKEFRRWFQQRSLLPESVWQAKVEKDGSLAAGMERVRYALRDFGEALQATYDTENPNESVIRRLNEALQNGYRENIRPEQGELFAQPDPEERPEDIQPHLFGTDPPLGPAYEETEQTLAEMTFIEDLPEPVREATGRLRDEIDQLSRLAIRSGLYTGELKAVVEENMGTYVTRQYKAHNEDGYADTVKQAVRDYAGEDLTIDPDDVPGSLGVDPETWNKAVAHMRSNWPEMSEKQVLGRLFELLTTADEGPLTEGGSTLGSVGQSIYERRKNIPVPLRDLLGEYKDPRENYLNSMTKMLHGVTNQKFLNQVKQNGLGDWLRTEPVVEDGIEYTEQIAAEGSRTMQPLNGLYTTKEIAQTFEEFENEGQRRGWLFRHYMKATSLVKANLTVFSFTLQMRNYLSAYLFGLSQGHWFDHNLFSSYKEAHSRTYDRVFQQEDDEAQRQFTQKMLRLGILDESPRAGEMRDMWRDAGFLLENPEDGHERLAAKYAKAIPRFAERTYRAGDNVHKIAAFLIEKARYEEAYPQKSEQEIDRIAADRVRNGFPTYSLVPKFIRSLRRNPFVSSFPSFFAEVVRNRYNTLQFIKEDLSDPRTRSIGVKRALGEFTNATIWGGLTYASMSLAGVDDEMDELFRRFLPSWEKFSYLFYLPSEDGQQQFVDLGYLNPNAMFHEPVMALLQGEDLNLEGAAMTAGYRAMQPFVSSEILTKAVFESLQNQSLEDGRPIVNPQLPVEDQVVGKAKHVGKNLVPRVAQTVNEGVHAFTDAEEGYGIEGPTKLEAIVSPLAGQNIRTVDMGNALKWRTIDLQNKYRNAGSIWYDTITKRGTVSRSELEDAYRTSLQRKKELIEEAHKDVGAAEAFGLSHGQAYSILRSQRVSKPVAVGVMTGRFFPQPDFNVLQGRIQQERRAGNTEDANILQKRQQLAMEVMQKVATEFQRPNDEAARQDEESRLPSSTDNSQ